jgi:hypothetical protein
VSKLAPGSNGDVLTTSGGVPTWTNVSSLETDPQVGTLSTGQVAFWDGSALTGDNNLFWDNSNGRLGIGTASPAGGLNLHGKNLLLTSSSASNGFSIELNGSNVELRQNENAAIVFRTNAGAGTDTARMQLTADGRLFFFSPSNGASFRIDLPNSLNSAVGMGRARSWQIYSSARWKEDIRPIEGALEKVLALNGVRYRWKSAFGGNDDIGFIAEEAGAVLPEVVQRDEKTGEYLAMDYMRIVPVLVEAIKEQHRRNEELRAELAELRRLVEQLAARHQVTAGASTITVRVDGDWLGNNVPNPHDGTTTIPYYVPSAVSRAQLNISDVTGRLVRSIELPSRDVWSQVTLDMSILPSGTYEYSLVLDGRVVATKQMQLVK